MDEPQELINRRQKILKRLEIPEIASTIQLEDFDKIYLAIRPLFQTQICSKINWFIRNVLKGTNEKLSFDIVALQLDELAKEAVRLYLFKSCRWKDGVPLESYFYKAFPGLCLRELNSVTALKKINVFTCPACKEFGIKQGLVEVSNNKLECENCFGLVNSEDKVSLYRYKLAEIFKSHSKKGVQCPACLKFVPISAKENGKLICPYKDCNTDCTNITESFYHPIGSIQIHTSHLDNEAAITKFSNRFLYNSCSSSKSVENLTDLRDVIKSINNVIDHQKVVNGKTRNSPNKTIMYNSISKVIQKYPVEMVDFLVRREKVDLPMQAIIFQEFSKNMVNELPIEFSCGSRKIIINDPLDEKLKLFSGIYSFVGTVDNKYQIKKHTTLLKNRGEDLSTKDCSTSEFSFIGNIRKVMDENCNNLIDCVDMYSFVGVKFKRDKVVPGQKLYIEYYGIPAHYSMQSMAHLRRIMKKIYQSCKAKKI